MKNFSHPTTLIILITFCTINSFTVLAQGINYSDTSAFRNRIEIIFDKYSSDYDSLQEALKLSVDTKNKLLIAKCRNKIGIYFANNDNYAKAIQNFKIAANQYFSVNDSLKYTSCLRAMAIMYEYAGINDSSLILYKQCLNNFGALNNLDGMIETNMDVGVFFWKKSEYAKAIEHYYKSLEYIEQLNDSSYYSAIWNNMGLVYWDLGDYELALQYFYKSLGIAEKMSIEDMKSYYLNNIGLIHEEMGEYGKALEYYKKSLKTDMEQENESGVATSYSNMSVAYLLKNEYDSALAFVSKSLDINTRLNYKVGIAEAYFNISNINYELGNYTEALINNKKALKIREEIDNKKGIALCYTKYAEIYIKQRKYMDAIRYLKKSSGISQDIGNKDDLLYIYELLSTAYSKTGKFKEAYEYSCKFKKLREDIYSDEKSKSIAEMQIRFDVQKKEQQIELLSKEQEIKNAELEKSIAEINYQRKIRNFSILLFVFVLGILGLVFNRFKINRQKSEFKLQKENIEFENKLLRSQMNPHFIFNSLYSIQSFVAKNQSEMAVSHLSNFAALMRAILHNSAKSFITLDKELETIELYLKLEKLRFENRFDYTIDIPEDLELEFIQIPPMLIQPFIENAIIHGFSNKEEKGKLKITFKELNNLHLLCTVSDDGIGRKKAQELKQKSDKVHNSMALNITQNRLNLLNKELGTNGKIIIKDLNKEEHTGTIVEMHIPIKES